RTSVAAATSPATRRDPASLLLEVVIEALFRAAEAQHRPKRGRLLRRQLHDRAGALPQRPFAGKDVMHLIRFVLRDAEAVEGQLGVAASAAGSMIAGRPPCGKCSGRMSGVFGQGLPIM